ncbi:hypothetical protein RGU12_19745 [Fredinandcohnia sp. QZ13]|nr:hypothetical protein [Fredinandcohnia sp. QZ13]MDR4889730.1 hypothetical protein [Fredinandcohnia sp. QZ13]
MTFVFLAIIVVAVSLSIFKAVRKKQMPSNEYTPFDDVTMGRTEDKK